MCSSDLRSGTCRAGHHTATSTEKFRIKSSRRRGAEGIGFALGSTPRCIGPLRTSSIEIVSELAEFQALDVVGVRVEMPSNQPIVLLKEIGTIRYLPIWVGAVEATAIAFAQQGITSPRPMTHDLAKLIIESLGAGLDSVHLTELKDGVFYAKIGRAHV